MHKLKLITLLLATLIGSQVASAGNPTIKLETSFGDIVLELYPDKAPKTVENFLGYVQSGYYDGTIFHRVISDFMIQGGGFNETFFKKPTLPPVKNEADNGLINNRGMVAMARTSAPHSATSQFFINSISNAFLNFKHAAASGWGYCVFGRVILGMDVVDKISAVKTGMDPKGMGMGDVPAQNVVIKKATYVNAPKPEPKKAESPDTSAKTPKTTTDKDKE